MIRTGEKSETLYDRTISVANALQPDTEIDMDYYIEKQIIPAIDRFLGAVDNKLKISPDNYLKKARINEDSSVSGDLNVEDSNICIICGKELRDIFKLIHLYGINYTEIRLITSFTARTPSNQDGFENL